jgi:hypothetical protein
MTGQCETVTVFRSRHGSRDVHTSSVQSMRICRMRMRRSKCSSRVRVRSRVYTLTRDPTDTRQTSAERTRGQCVCVASGRTRRERNCELARPPSAVPASRRARRAGGASAESRSWVVFAVTRDIVMVIRVYIVSVSVLFTKDPNVRNESRRGRRGRARAISSAASCAAPRRGHLHQTASAPIARTRA